MDVSCSSRRSALRLPMRASDACTSVEHIPAMLGTGLAADRHGAAWASLWYTLSKRAELCSGTCREPSPSNQNVSGQIGVVLMVASGRSAVARGGMIMEQRARVPKPIYPVNAMYGTWGRPGWEVHVALRMTSRSRSERSGRSRPPLCRESPPHPAAAIDATSARSKEPKILGTDIG